MDRLTPDSDARLSESEIEAIAAAVARRLQGQPAVRLLYAPRLAAALGVERDWVYRNAMRLARFGSADRTDGCASISPQL